MDISFGHDRNNNYMIIKLPYTRQGYKHKMIEKNHISGLLEVHYTVINGELQMKYNISSKVAYRDICSREKINSSLLRELLQGIVDIVEKTGSYLLDVNNIMLSKDMIYWDTNRKNIFLCYNPEYQGDFLTEFRELVQQLLSDVDYSDSVAVSIVYKVNEWCNSDCTDIRAIKEIADTSTGGPESSWNQSKSDTPECSNENTGAGQNCNEYNESILKQNHFFGSFCELIKKKIGIFREEIREGINVSDDEMKGMNKKLADSETDINNIDEDIGMGNNNINETMLVSDALMNKRRCLVSICEADNINIEKYPFVIGKLDINTDGVIKHNSISRIQAKISYSDNQYFIEDLNSKNGTYVNDERIEPYEKAEIKIGDKIGFADINFIFR